MRTFAALAGCIAVALLVGCGDDDQAPDQLRSETLVTYERSGGIASVPERLMLEEDGSATVEAGVDGDRGSFELEGDELDQLRAELEAADFDAIEQPPQPSGCADCYVYEIVYHGATISYDEADPPPASVATVVAHLGEITADHYPPGAF
jgi:hypothetical protein